MAGCEQLKLSRATGAQKQETVGINRSLMVLTKCIRALVQAKKHVPFMESKLTMLLKNSLGGSSRTSTIVTGAMDDVQAGQTLQALRFGEAVAQITNKIGGESALNAETALAGLTGKLEQAKRTLVSLEEREKTHLEAYQKTARMVRALEAQFLELRGLVERG